MLQNYLKIAIRSLGRNKLYSGINIAGLAVGLAASLLIVSFILHELSYDRFHAKSKHIYTVFADAKFGEQSFTTDNLSAAFGPEVKAQVPGVQQFCRVYASFSNGKLQSDNQHHFEEKGIKFSDASFFEMFDFKLKSGDPKTALTRPMTMVLTEEKAKQFFGNKDPIGKTLLFRDQLAFEITGVLKNLPKNTNLKFNFLGSLSSVNTVEKAFWGSSAVRDDDLSLASKTIQLGSFTTYFEIRNEQTVKNILAALPKMMKTSGTSDESIKRDKYSFIKLTDLHLADTGLSDGIVRKYVMIFGTIAILILLLALINYMSLATAQATQRAKEVGVRKTNGAKRSQLITQFYIESGLTTCIAFCIAFVLFELLQKPFYELLNVKVELVLFQHSLFYAAVLGLLVLCILLAGSYPALLLSSFVAAKVLKGSAGLTASGINFRRGITVFQFVVSATLIICSLVAFKQLKFMQNYEIGMQKDQMLVVHLPQNNKYDAFKNGLKSMPSLDHISVNSMELFQNSGGRFFVTNPFDRSKTLGFAFMNIDKAFLENMKIDWVVKPRDMNQIGTEKTMIINQAAATQLGKNPKDMLDIQLSLGNTSSKVIGVVKNFHFMSIHSPVEPMTLMVASEKELSMPENNINFYIQINPHKDIQAQISDIGQLHKKLMPNESFSYYFLDQAFNKLYQSEERLSKMFGVFTLLALFISCLGLFGLATFSAQRRTKEIGIRKVLGASVLQISTLLSKEFLKLVLLAIVLACPIGWWLMQTWLKDFAYKTTISWQIYTLAGILTLAIAIGTVVYQSIQSAMMNPIQSLKTE